MTMTEDDTTTTLLDQATTDQVTLPGNRCTVTMNSGVTFQVRITNHCYIAWDKTAPKKKWGAMADVPYLAATFMAWTAAKREGATDLGWDAWQEAVADLTMLGEEPEDLAFPTQKGQRPETS